MTVQDIIDDLVSLAGLGGIACATASLKASLLNRLNEALQTIASSPKAEFMVTEAIELTLEDGIRDYTLDATVAKVIGPAWWKDTEVLLRPCSSWGEFLQAGSTTTISSENRPTLYFAESRKSVSGTEQVGITLHLTRIPDEGHYGKLMVMVAKEPARYTTVNTTVVPMAHGYVESILLPIIRYLAFSSQEFANNQKLVAMMPYYRERYDAALVQLGLSNPNETALTGSTRETENR